MEILLNQVLHLIAHSQHCYGIHHNWDFSPRLTYQTPECKNKTTAINIFSSTLAPPDESRAVTKKASFRMKFKVCLLQGPSTSTIFLVRQTDNGFGVRRPLALAKSKWLTLPCFLHLQFGAYKPPPRPLHITLQLLELK